MDAVRIMIVEDEGITSAYIQMSLEELGFVVTSISASSEEALINAEHDRPDLILMDIKIKGAMDGIDTANEIRRRCNLPIVYLTAHSDGKTLERAKLSEPFGYVVKPIEIEALKSTIEMALYKYQMDSKLKQSHEQLIQSEKMRSLGQLVAGVAHEINNPLGFIITNMGHLMEFTNCFIKIIETFSAFVVPENHKAELESVKESCNYNYIKERSAKMIERSKVGLDRIKKIVLDLKSFSKIDRAEIQETDINESIAVILALLTHECKDNITIVTEYGKIPPIKCYGSQLNQVFMNILINACQAVQANGEIRVKTSIVNEMIEIEISDTGKGIAPEVRHRIFDPFFTTKPIGIGTGLGLSTSLGVIKKHNGEITVESTEGAGSTFTIKIPINNTLN